MTKEKKLVEICRSFAYKLNVPGKYESRDFWASQKAECYEEDAEKVSEKLHEFVRNEVMKSVADYQFSSEPDKAVAQGNDWKAKMAVESQKVEEGQDNHLEEEANQKFAEEVDNIKL